MKKRFSIGRAFIEIGIAPDGCWWVTSENGIRHAFLVSLGMMTNQKGVPAAMLFIGPLSITVADIKGRQA